MHVSIRILSAAILLPLVLAGCASKKPAPSPQQDDSRPVLSDEPADSVTVFESPVSPNAQMADATHGQVSGISIGALTGIDSRLANGVVTAYYFEDKGSIVGMQLNIAAVEKGMFYTASLEDPVTKKKLPLGKLESMSNEVRHSLRFDTALDLRPYTAVIITLEGGADGAVVVANGQLKATK